MLIEYCMQFLHNFTEFACCALLPIDNLLFLVLLQKVIGHPFDHFACVIRELHAKPIMSAIFRWKNFKIKKMEVNLKFYLPFTGFYTHEGLSNYNPFRPI